MRRHYFQPKRRPPVARLIRRPWTEGPILKPESPRADPPVVPKRCGLCVRFAAGPEGYCRACAVWVRWLEATAQRAEDGLLPSKAHGFMRGLCAK